MADGEFGAEPDSGKQAEVKKPPVSIMQTKAAFIQPIISKVGEPIPISLKHRKIKQFQYTFSPVKSIG
jgi:hypothetical protein